MLITIPQLLDPQALQTVRSLLDNAGPAWVDGRVTAGYQGAPVKYNQQIDEQSDVALQCQRIIVSALERHPRFISAALPNLIYPPMFNRYGEGMTFGAHVDGSVRFGERHRHHNPLASSQSVSLDDNGGALRINVGMSGRDISKGLIFRSRDAMALHEVLGKGLGAFQLRRLLRRAEDAQAARAELVHHASGQRLDWRPKHRMIRPGSMRSAAR